MHFHLPKPLHGWRQFFGEVGIIVIGVLIALGAEQVAQSVHWRFETDQLRASLHREIKDDLQNAAYDVAVSPCVRGRIRRLDRELSESGTSWRGDAADDGKDARWQALPVAFKVSDVEGFYTDGQWQTALASGALAHISESERNGFSYAYGAIADLSSYAKDEDKIAARLQPLAMPQRLSDEQRVAFETDLASLDRVNALLTVYSRKMLEGGRRGGIAPRPADIEAVYQQARADYGACATRLGSTYDALSPGNNAYKPQQE
jgi:hypothetical protein